MPVVVFFAFVLIFTQTYSIYIVSIAWLFFAFIGIVFQKKVYFPLNKIQIIWLAFTLLTLFSTLVGFAAYSNEYNYSKVKLSLFVIFCLNLPLFTMKIFKSNLSTEAFFTLFRNFMIICAVIGLFEYLSRIQLYLSFMHSIDYINNYKIYGNIKLSNYRMMLFFYHPIHYGILLACGIVSLWYIPLKSKFLNYIAYILILVNIILTQARTSWIILIVIFLLIYLRKIIRNKLTTKLLIIPKKLVIRIAVIMVILVTAYYFVYSPNFEKIRLLILNRTINNNSTNPLGARLYNFSLIPKITDKYNLLFWLFGGGHGFAICYLRNNPSVAGWNLAIDNQFLTNFINFGIFGLVIYVYLGVYILIQFFKSNDKMNLICYLVMIVIYLSGFSFEPIGVNMVYFMFIIAISQVKKEKDFFEDFLNTGERK